MIQSITVIQTKSTVLRRGAIAQADAQIYSLPISLEPLVYWILDLDYVPAIAAGFWILDLDCVPAIAAGLLIVPFAFCI